MSDTIDVAAVKRDVAVLGDEVDGKPLIYLDSAASSQRPGVVIDAMRDYYEHHHANVHRGAYRLAAEADAAYERGRRNIARFIGAPSAREVIFTKNATEAINLVAFSWGRANLGPGDAVVLTELEHHANIVPWQILSQELGFEIRWLSVREDGHLETGDLERVLDGAKLLALTAMSNVLGTITPLRQLADAAHGAGALVLADACQYVPHLPTDVSELDVDFLAFSGHKMLGPTGIGVLWGREALLDAMPPFLGGGGMISDVRLDGFDTAELPAKFEAGTPPIAEAVGLGVAVEYLEHLGMAAVRRHEVELTAYALRTLRERFGDDLVIHGPSEPAERGGVMSFAYKDVHPHDVSQVLDQDQVCVRAGHHCAKPLMRRLGVGATARASWYVYNDESDVDAFAESLSRADEWFGF